jgi:hypothetical protein
MSDQRSRGGKKQGGNDPQNPEQHQTVHANQPRPESSDPSDQGRKPMDRPKGDPSEAPESGTREPADNG